MPGKPRFGLDKCAGSGKTSGKSRFSLDKCSNVENQENRTHGTDLSAPL